MKDDTYNGWTNYETWLVALWLDNEEESQRHWEAQARFLLSEEGIEAHRGRWRRFPGEDENIVSIMALEEQLKEEVSEGIQSHIQDACLAYGLLNAAINRVNWRELAEHYIDVHKRYAAN